MKEKFSLKDHLFNKQKVEKLARELFAVYPEFKKEAFVQDVVEAFPRLELKDRIKHIREILKKYLPDDYKTAIGIIVEALPEPLDETKSDNDFGDFIYAPYGDFIAQYGTNLQNLEHSFQALHEVTKRFSMEDAIRYCINTHPQETMRVLKVWSNDANYHVRRLSSEGTRPKLPWSQKITIDVTEALPILNTLFADTTRYVTRSVANHMNDISKVNPRLVIETLVRWRDSKKQKDSEMSFIIKHSLRTLVKAGNKDALKLVGVETCDGLEVAGLSHGEIVAIGDAIDFSFYIQSTVKHTVVIDYIVYFQSKQGTLSNKKIYKLKSFVVAARQKIFITKSHVFKKDMTTRSLYPGRHHIDIQVNGEVLAGFDFELTI